MPSRFRTRSNQKSVKTHNEKEKIMMDQIDRDQLYNTAWKHFGADRNLDICIEEIAEFIQEIIKYRRYGSIDTVFPETFAGEIADVCICIEQIKTRMKKMPYGVPNTGINTRNLWDDQVMVLKWQKISAFKNPSDAIKIDWDRVILKLTKFVGAIITTRNNGEIFSYEVADKLASVYICIKQIRNEMKEYPRASKNHIVGDNGTEWDTVMEIKEKKLERLKERLFESMSKKYPCVGDHIKGWR
jgi:NTP pyrophosphatase (non-canonical NTP hydrolase)